MISVQWGSQFKAWYNQKPRNRMHVAYQCGVQPQQVSEWLRGVTPKRHVTRERIKSYTAIDVDAIIREQHTSRDRTVDTLNVEAPIPPTLAYLSELPRIRVALETLVQALG